MMSLLRSASARFALNRAGRGVRSHTLAVWGTRGEAVLTRSRESVTCFDERGYLSVSRCTTLGQLERARLDARRRPLNRTELRVLIRNPQPASSSAVSHPSQSPAITQNEAHVQSHDEHPTSQRKPRKMTGSDGGRSDNGEEQQPRDHHHDDAQLNAGEGVQSQKGENDGQEHSGQQASRPAERQDDNDDDEVGHTNSNSDQDAHHEDRIEDADADPENDSSSGVAYESVAPPGRVSVSSEHDDRTPTMAHREQFNALQDHDDDDKGAHDHSPRAYAASASAAASPDRRRHRRPFSLVSQPDSPSASSLSTLDSATSPARRPSLLASSMTASSATSSLAAADPTNVGRESSASLTQAVWRQSMGLHTNPAHLSKELVDVQLNDEDGEAGLDEEAKEAKRKKRRSAVMSWNSAAFSSANGNASVNGLKSMRMSAQYCTGSETVATALAAPFEEDESSSSKHSPSSPPSPTHSQSSSPSASADTVPISLHDRSDSISTANAIASPHAADGFISHRASANLSSLMQPVSPANPPQSNTGIRALQANFESLRSLKERQGGGDEKEEIDWEFWGRVMSDYEEVAKSQRESFLPPSMASFFRSPREFLAHLCFVRILAARELSRAIQRGIPPALRGMTWQLMS